MKPLLSIGEAARLLGISVDTVREMENSGQIRALRTAGGHRRFRVEDVEALLRRHSGSPRSEAPRSAPTRRMLQRRRQTAPITPHPYEVVAEPFDDGPGDDGFFAGTSSGCCLL